MKKIILALLLAVLTISLFAQNISGTIKDAKGNVLAYASVLVKGSTIGVSSNANGYYSLTLNPGNYTLVCQFIGYKASERKVKLEAGKNEVIDFELTPQQYDLQDVVVKNSGEDPAYAIMRQAIAKRTVHLRENRKFSADVYLKGQLQLRDYPKRFFGQKVDFEDGDSSKRKMLFLSESIAKYSVEEPNKEKVEVISTKVSGRSNSFGFSSPQIISFYNNNVEMGEGLNPRGFISPVSANALTYYKYKFEGTFYEDGIEINRIKVIPKRKYEPLFSGYINIVENEWRIHSLRLYLLREQQMQFLDTLVVEQQYVPVPASKTWVIKNQVIYPSGKIFGFDFFGSFVQVYDRFNLQPAFEKGYFNNTVLKFYDSSNKRSMAYWDSVRPLPLSPEEMRDYVKKDSLEQLRNDPRYLDSIDRKRNKVTIVGVLLTGQSYSKQKRRETVSFESVLNSLNYNTVEGAVVNFSPVWTKQLKKEGRGTLRIAPYFRYGITNGHFNAHLSARYSFGKKYFNSVTVSGGRRVFQFNNNQPILPRANTYSTLLYENNHMKLYEANFFRAAYNTGIGNGLTFGASFQFQDRFALNNLIDPVSWKNISGREFTPNYPVDLVSSNMPRNQAAQVTVGLNWQPGGKYIEIPDRKIAIGSDWPNFSVSLTHGIKGLLGSDADFTKWRFLVSDDINLKMGGELSYRLMTGGFLRAKQVALPDYQHYQGNQTVIANDPLSGFLLAPYYKYSNTSSFYSAAHGEYHLNGLLTNKIPGFRRLNWFLVMGGNMLYVKNGATYFEAFAGLENILKIMRVDFVKGFEKNGPSPFGVRITLPFLMEGGRDD